MVNLTRTALAGLAAAAIAGGVGCASSSSGASGGDATGPEVEHAKRVVDKARAIPEFTLDAPVIDAAKAEGKHIFHIPANGQIAFQQTVTAALERTADKLGVQFTDRSTHGTPAEWAQAMDQAITARPDLILLDGVDPALIMPQMIKAKRAGIPVVSGVLYQDAESVPEKVKPLLTAIVGKPWIQAGALQATYAFSKRGKDLNPLVLSTPDFLGSEYGERGVSETLEKLCGDACEPTFIRLVAAEWDNFRGEVQSALNRDPSINYILPLYDNMALPVAAGLKAVGRSDQAPIATYNGTPEALDLVREGDIQMDIGESLEWYAMAMLDQSLRVLVGAEPIADGDEQTPLRVFDESNVEEAGVPATATEGYGDSYIKGYEKLWSVQGLR